MTCKLQHVDVRKGEAVKPGSKGFPARRRQLSKQTARSPAKDNNIVTVIIGQWCSTVPRTWQ